MNTSFSALNTYRICPLKYKYQNVDKIKAKKSPEAIFGTLVHDTMKFIHSGGFTNQSLKKALHNFSTHWNPEAFEDETKERAAFAQGIKYGVIKPEVSDQMMHGVNAYLSVDPSEPTMDNLEKVINQLLACASELRVKYIVDDHDIDCWEICHP